MLSSKQRSYLRSMANTYDPIIQIGKGNITTAIETAVLEALEARELIKIRILKNAEGDVKALAIELADKLKAEVVQVIGRNFILYKQNSEKPKLELPL